MTTLIHGAWHQVKCTLKTPSRLNVLLALLLVLVGIGLLFAIQTTPKTVQYNEGDVPVIRPIEAEICLGGAVHYPLVTTIDKDQIPGRVEVDESWCMEGLAGPCKSAAPPNPRLPLLEEKRVVQPSTERVMPKAVTPGVWHFWHTSTDTHGNVEGYIVAPIVVVDCPTP